MQPIAAAPLAEQPTTGLITLRMERRFTKGHEAEPFFDIEWASRIAEIKGEDDKKVFRAEGLEFPSDWSQTAVNIVAEKYFRVVEGANGVKETSVRQMVMRIANTLMKWGVALGHLTEVNGPVFRDELVNILVHQRAMFNSPVLFNVGTRGGRLREEQCSACFINSVEDDMESILELSKTEGRLYKGGSGSGVNYSKLRSSRENLSQGGTASGPVPFIAKDDSNAGGIKSGGATRRAAKMAILNVDHGDIFEFVECKAKSERMAHALIDAGFDGDFRARFGAYQSVPFQNANHSVRVTDEFMSALEADGAWNLMARDGVTVIETVKARDLWDRICRAAWICGDPGLQFDTTINRWHPTPADGRINASNPCSEYMSHDDTACNLASINIRKCLKADGSLDVDVFNHIVDIMVTAQEIIVDGAKYPTPLLEKNATRFRQLGLGYANLGAWFMAQGIPYDSNRARTLCSLVTALTTGRAYRRSAELAEVKGPFPAYDANRASFTAVVQQHRDALTKVLVDTKDMPLALAAAMAWSDAAALGAQHGYRNSQATVLAPTGTIGFAMDCDTTGIEPDVALRKQKKLVGGGSIIIANQRVGDACRALGYPDRLIEDVSAYVVKNGSVVGAPGVYEEHLPVFDCSFPDPIGKRALRPEAHILMLAAAQPFVSGAISKTCNIPDNATVEDIDRLYRMAWTHGLKAVALYRDGSKRSQPLQVEKKGEGLKAVAPDLEAQLYAIVDKLKPTGAPCAIRRKLPDERDSKTHKFSISGHDGYVTVGMYADGTMGEMFIRMAKEGSTVSGLMDCFATAVSIALQHGVPLTLLIEKFSRTKFDPAGYSSNTAIGQATSIMDYLFRWLELKFFPMGIVATELPEATSAMGGYNAPNEASPPKRVRQSFEGPPCFQCGAITVRCGSCHTCPECGTTTGCG